MAKYAVIVFLAVLGLSVHAQSELKLILTDLEIALETLTDGQAELKQGLIELEEADNEVLQGLSESELALKETMRGLDSLNQQLTGLEDTVTALEADLRRDQFWRWIERGTFVAAIVAILIWR